MNTRRQYLALGLVVGMGAPLLAGQVTSSTMGAPPPPAPPKLILGTGVITGVVVDAVTNTPIPGAVVFLNRQVRDNVLVRLPRQLTDAKGRFAFTELPASEAYTIAAGQFGYFDGGYSEGGQPGTTNRSFTLADGQWITDARVVLARPASVSGIVTDETGEPLAGLYVRVLAKIAIAGHAHLASGPSATTDDRGQYRIANLPPGQYIVTVPSVQASVIATDAPPTLLAGGNIAMQGGAPGRSVEPPPSEPALESGGPTRLLLGRFAVPPPPHDGQVFAYPIAFYGGSSDISRAVTLDLKLGDSRSGIDIKLEPVATTTISGTVQAGGETPQRLTLRLLHAGLDEAGEGNEAATTAVKADGTFTFHGVAAGAYVIDAPPFIGEYGMNTTIFSGRPPGRSVGSATSDAVPAGPPGTQFVRLTSRSTTRWGRTPVTVTNRPVTGVVLTLRDLSKLYGYAVIDADPALPGGAAPAFAQLRAESATATASQGRVDSRLQAPDYEIAFENLLHGPYLIRGNLPAGWVVKSVTLNGRDHTTTPIEMSGGTMSGLVVTVTNRVATLSGTVRDAQGAIERNATVVLYPADPGQWTDYGLAPSHIKSVAVRGDGTYRLGNLPAGDYLVAAVAGDDVSQWQAPGFFKRAATAATRLRLDWSESRTQDLRTQSVTSGGGQ